MCYVSFYFLPVYHQSTVYHSATVRNIIYFILISYDGRPCRHCCAGKLLFLGTVTSFLQRNKFRCQVQNTKPRYMRALATMFLKYACEFSRYLMTSHTRASKSQTEVVRRPKSKHKSKLVLTKVESTTAAL